MSRAVEEEKSADHLLGFSEGAIEQARAAFANLDARRVLVRLQRFAGEQEAACLQVGGVLQHLCVGRLAFGFGALGALAGALHDEQHVGHV